MEVDANQLVISSPMGVDANPLSMDDSQHRTLGRIEQQHAAIHLTVILDHMEMDVNPLVVLSGIQHGIRGPTAQQHAATLLTGIIPHLQAPVEVTILHLEPLHDVIPVLIQIMVSHQGNMDVYPATTTPWMNMLSRMTRDTFQCIPSATTT